MKRVALTLGLAAVMATPAVAQWLGEPVWNSPGGGTGVTISGDYAHPNEGYGKGNTWGGRASLGLSTITLTAGVASWKPAGATQSLTSVGGNVAFRLIGGSLLPVAINMQLGGASTSSSGVRRRRPPLSALPASAFRFPLRDSPSSRTSLRESGIVTAGGAPTRRISVTCSEPTWDSDSSAFTSRTTTSTKAIVPGRACSGLGLT